jgi:mono/diheme cytochrome c family protein
MLSGKTFMVVAMVLGPLVFPVKGWAETPADFLGQFEKAARAADGAFSSFSPQRGEQFFKSRQGNEWSCSSCHMDNAAGVGRHAKTGKRIEPLAPAANATRFTSARAVEKWFGRNCNDVLGRACTPREKGDVLAWLMTVRN